MNAHTIATDRTASRLIEALESDGFLLYQQRIVPLQAGPPEMPYQEILIRFREEEEKLLPPGMFIPVLESCGLMNLLDRWVVSRVLRWMQQARAANPAWDMPACSVNLSRDTLAYRGFAQFVRLQLEKTRVSGRHLLFEIAECDAADATDGLARTIAALAPLGCRFTLTGYRDERFRADALRTNGIASVKLDIDLVTALRQPARREEARRIQSRCDAWGVRTIAECVETADTLAELKAIGVHYAQGYGIAMPAPL